MLTISWSTATEGIVFLTDDESEEGTRELVFTENVIQFDCVTSETHEGISELTEHAVETGAPISDHKRVKPRRLTIECLVTNTPLDAPPPSGAGDGSNPITAEVRSEDDDAPGEGGGQRARAQVVVFSAAFDRMTDVHNALDALRTGDEFVTITTRIRTYENMQIVSVTSPREAPDGDSLRFNIEAVEVRIAETSRIDTPSPREPRGSTTTERGAREGTEPRESALHRLFGDDGDGDASNDGFMSRVGSVFGGGS